MVLNCYFTLCNKWCKSTLCYVNCVHEYSNDHSPLWLEILVVCVSSPKSPLYFILAMIKLCVKAALNAVCCYKYIYGMKGKQP